MNMAIPLFLFFSVFAAVNVYLPLFFRNMGYSTTQIGFLLAIYEIAGTIIPFFLCRRPAQNGKYGLYLLFLSFLLILVPFPLLLLPTAGTIFCIALYSVAVKAVVPISDSYINLKLGLHRDKYGMVRSFGSLGFVITNLVMQYFVKIDTISLIDSALWLSVPAILLGISLIVIPGLLKTYAPEGIVAKTAKNEKIKKIKDRLPTIQRVQGFFNQFSPFFWLMMAVLTLGTFGQSATNRFFSLYVKEYLNSDSFAILWALAALCEIPFMFFSYRFIRRFGSHRLIVFCVLMIFVRNLLYVIFPSVAGAAFAQMFNSVTFGLLFPAAVMFIAEQVTDKKNVVMGQAIYSIGAMGLANVVGSSLGGIIVDTFGYPTLYASFAVFPLLGVALYGLLRKKVQR